MEGESSIRGWPEGWPRYRNCAQENCDVVIGPCVCGAWHKEGEFELHEGFLFRYGYPVAGEMVAK